ncbi:Hexose carrier protein HEX6, partial [Bienertia sinuspersici]
VIPMYLVEIAPSKYRGAFNNGFHLSLSLGILLATLVNLGTQKIKGGWGWRFSIGATAIPAFIITLGSIFLPETPNSLIQGNKKDHQKAKLILRKIRGSTDVEQEFNDLIEAAASSSKTSASLISSVIIGVVQIIADIFAVLTVDRFGRRSLFFWGLGWCSNVSAIHSSGKCTVNKARRSW